MRIFPQIIFSFFVVSGLAFSAHGQNKTSPAQPKVVAAVPAKPDPEKIYQDDFTKCTLQCCDFAKPAVLQAEVPFYEKPFYFQGDKSATPKNIGLLKSGQKVMVLKGIQFSKPIPLVVKVAHKVESKVGEKFTKQALKKEHTIYVLGSTGYGFLRVWVDGRIVEIHSVDFFDIPAEGKFTMPSTEDRESRAKAEQVWYQVKSEESGATGWILDESGAVIEPQAGCRN